MAVTFSLFLKSSILVILLALLLHPSVSTSDAWQNEKVTESQLHKICSKLQDPCFCMKTLKSDPRTAKADLHGLVKISLDLAMSKIKENKLKVKEVIKNVTDPKEKTRCKYCIEFYENAIGDLKDAKDALKSKDYVRVGVNGDSCSTYVDNCWTGEVTQPEKPFLPDDNNKAFQLCLVVGITARSIN